MHEIYLGLLFLSFFKIWSYCSASTFSQPDALFLHVFFWNIEYILDNISRNPGGLEKNSYWLFKNTFPIETDIINLFHYIWGISFIHNNT